MGRVFKKNTGAKRGIEVEKKEEVVTTKKAKKEEPVQVVEEEEDSSDEEDVSDEEEIDDEELDDEEVEDEDGDEKNGDDEDEEDGDEEEVENQELQFDFSAFPPSEGDEDGIVNILTQTFLRTDIDLKGVATSIIEKSPHGVVLAQDGEDEEGEQEEESEVDEMVYGLCTSVNLNETAKDDAPKFVKDIFAYLLNRAKKGAPSELYKKLEEIQSAGNGNAALFINERLLNFPHLVVPQVFTSFRNELENQEYKKYKTFIYIQKIRIAESDGSTSSGKSGSSEPPKKKGKMGKAEKKRAAAAALASADIEFDNIEDKFLFNVAEGKEVHFDYPVHMDVEPGSKFHIVEKDGQKWNPFRRVVIMDDKRLKAFLERGGEAIVEDSE